MRTTEKIRIILTALGYTPDTLAEDTGMSQYEAKRILKDKDYEIKSTEFLSVCNLTGISPNLFMGCRKAAV